MPAPPAAAGFPGADRRARLGRPRSSSLRSRVPRHFEDRSAPPRVTACQEGPPRRGAFGASARYASGRRLRRHPNRGLCPRTPTRGAPWPARCPCRTPPVVWVDGGRGGGGQAPICPPPHRRSRPISPRVRSSLEIAQAASPRPVADVAAELGLRPEEIELHGPHVAKVGWAALARAADGPKGRLVLVTAITPTSLGEGKTTTLVGLVDALRQRGVRVAGTLRQASLGPVFGAKGGATGGGRAQVVPVERVNLHLTGDLDAVAAAQNLAAALVDNHLHHGNALGIEPASIGWPRALDVNDRALREVVVGLGGRTNGPVRESGFVITAASEVMAILALARDLADLRRRLGRAVVARRRGGVPVTLDDLRAAGAMAALLAEAGKPNLVPTPA